MLLDLFIARYAEAQIKNKKKNAYETFHKVLHNKPPDVPASLIGIDTFHHF